MNLRRRLVAEVADLHPCTQYALEVVTGFRVAGQAEISACKRHLDDLDRTHSVEAGNTSSDDWPWIFDTAKANKIYAWFRYCKHVEGPKAGQPIELEPFQQFDLGSIFGWVHRDTGLRRFEKAYIQEARKQGKSTIMSGVALYLMAGDGEEGPQVFCAAVDKGQARIIYRAAKAMAQKSPDIRKRLNIHQYEISHKSRGGQMVALSKDTQNKDGLNPHGVIIDEYHAHPTSEIYDLLASAWGQRLQALFLIITTAGFDTEQNPCFKEYQYCKNILDKSPANERYFVIIRELDVKDDVHDPANWIKANPLRAATPEGLKRLQEQHNEAFGSQDPAKIRNFKVKNLNIWAEESEDNYIGEYIKRWDGLAVSRKKFYEMTRGKACNVGIDLSKKIDLTADAFIFALPDDMVAICAHGFMPSEGVARHERTDRVEYKDWIANGWVSATEGDVTDYSRVMEHIQDMELEHGWHIQEICYDPYNATHFANEMQREGYTCVEKYGRACRR
jgi:phage terminase large subunit-like protein